MVTTFYPPYHFGGEAIYLYRLSTRSPERGHRGHRRPLASTRTGCSTAPAGGDFPHRPERHGAPADEHGARGSRPRRRYLTGRPGAQGSRADATSSTPERSTSSTSTTSSLFGGAGVLRDGAGACKLYTTHEHWLVCPMYDLWKMNRELCERARSASAASSPSTGRRSSGATRACSSARCRRSTCSSRRAASRSTQHRRARLRATRCGSSRTSCRVERDRARAAGGGRRRERPYFLFVGRLVELKGVDTLIEAFRDLRRRRPRARRRRGRRGASCERQAADLQHVRFLGRSTRTRCRSSTRARSRWSSRPSATRRSASSRSRRSPRGRP